MSIGALLGGAINRYGEKNRENWERNQKLEDIGRRASFDALLGHFEKNYPDMLPEEQEALIAQIETTVPGIKKGSLGPLVGGVRSISQIIPAVQAGAPPVTQRTSMEQLPTPSESAPSSIAYAPIPEHTIRTPSQTPRQVMDQRKLGSDRLMRQERLNEIRVSELPPEYKDALEASAMGLPAAASIETAQIRAKQAADALAAREAASGKKVFYRVPGQSPGSSNVVNYTVRGGKLYDQNEVEVQLPPNAVPLKESYTTTTDDAGNVNIINPQAAVGPGNYRSTIEGAGRRTQPRSSGSGAGASEDWNALADAVMKDPSIMATLTPTARTKITPILSARGFTQFGKPMSDTNIKQVSQSKSAVGALRYLSTIIKENEDKMGPIVGWWGKFNPYSDARKVQADIDRVKQEVGKTLEGGVLRKEDELKYNRILATLFDVPETAQYKLNGLIRDIERSIADYQTELGHGGRASDLSSPKQNWNSQKESRYQELLKRRGGK